MSKPFQTNADPEPPTSLFFAPLQVVMLVRSPNISLQAQPTLSRANGRPVEATIERG